MVVPSLGLVCLIVGAGRPNSEIFLKTYLPCLLDEQVCSFLISGASSLCLLYILRELVIRYRVL